MRGEQISKAERIIGAGAGLDPRTSDTARLRRPESAKPAHKLCLLLVLILGALWLLAFSPATAPADTIESSWEKIYAAETVETVRPVQAPVLAAPSQPTTPTTGEVADPLDYVSLRYGIEYTNNFVTFTGRPTRTYVVDDGPPLTPVPGVGISYPHAFKSDDNRLYSYLSFGTRAYGSSRLSTYFSLVTYHDLNQTRDGSPFIDSLDGFQGGNRTDLLNAYADLNGLTEDGPLSQVDARFGRQFVFDYDSWLLGSAVIDGVSLRQHVKQADLTVFFGWREAFFADPSSRFVTGGSVSYDLLPRTTARVDFFHYQSSQLYAVGVQHQFDTIFVDTHVSLINTNPIEFGSRASYSSPESPWSVYASFLQQLSADDFTYDAWYTSRDQDRIRRLNLFHPSPASQFSLDIDRQIFRWLSVGVGGWIRLLNSGADQAAFDNSFQEGTVRLFLTPLPQWDAFAQYRYRHIERSPAGVAETFDDISRSGETSYQEVSAETQYRVNERLRVTLGGYFRLFDTQDRYVRLVNINSGGLYAGFQLRLTDQVDFRFQYGVDNDYREFHPDIDLAHMFRVGLHFHYH